MDITYVRRAAVMRATAMASWIAGEAVAQDTNPLHVEGFEEFCWSAKEE